jgi:hypothetical protein
MAGIKYIKINRIDQSGIDNTNTLQSLDKILIKYHDIGIQTYDVINITEYSSYYLYYIIPQNSLTSSTDNTILHHHVSGTSYNSFTTDGTHELENYTSSFLSPLGWFNTSSGYYTLNKTPNIPIQISGSGTVTYSGAGLYSLNIRISSSINGTIKIEQIDVLGPGSSSFNISSSISNLIETEQINLVFVNTPSAGNTTVTASLLITQSISPTSSIIDQVIFEPASIDSFVNSDYEVLFNNVSTGRFSRRFMDLDYNEGILTPVNFDQVINQSAVKAEVQDYYYKYKRHTLPRYEGSRLYAANFNYYTKPTQSADFANGEVQQPWGGDNTKGGDVLASNPSTYIAYFEWIGGSPPEYKNGAGAKIKYLINENGDTFAPLLDDPYYNNLIDSFDSNKLAQVIQINTKANIDPNSSYYPVYRAGKQFAPIIYSQTGSSTASISTMSFGDNSSTTDFKFQAFASGTFYQDGGSFPGEAVNFSTSSGYTPTNVTWSAAPNNHILFNVAASNNRVKLKTKLTFYATTFSPLITNQNDPRGDCNVIVQIQKTATTFDGTNTEILAQLNFPVGLEETISKTLETSYFYTETSVKYRVAVFYESELGALYISLPGSFLVMPELYSSLEIYSGSGQFFFKTGSLSKNILTGSSQINEIIYGRDQVDVANSGYFTTLPFSVRVGDTIRFEYNENKSYYIKEVATPADSGSLFLTLDRNVDIGTNVNSFLIRRLVDDPSFIILDDIAASNVNGGGFLIPQYISPNLKEKLPFIIKKLSTENLI